MESNKITQPRSPSLSPVKRFTTQKNSKPMTDFFKATAQKPSSVSSGERVQVATKRPFNKKKFGITLVVVLLTIVIVASVALILVYPKATRIKDISINFKTDFTYKPVGVDIGIEQPPTTKYKVMPGDEISCTFSISSSKNEESDDGNLDVFLRVKAYFIGDGNFFNDLDFNFADADCWFKGSDGYYYYTKTASCDGLLSPGDMIDVSKNLSISKDIGNSYAGKSLNVMFSAEVLQAHYQAIVEIWKTAPFEWSYQFRNLI